MSKRSACVEYDQSYAVNSCSTLLLPLILYFSTFFFLHSDKQYRWNALQQPFQLGNPRINNISKGAKQNRATLRYCREVVMKGTTDRPKMKTAVALGTAVCCRYLEKVCTYSCTQKTNKRCFNLYNRRLVTKHTDVLKQTVRHQSSGAQLQLVQLIATNTNKSLPPSTVAENSLTSPSPVSLALQVPNPSD